MLKKFSSIVSEIQKSFASILKILILSKFKINLKESTQKKALIILGTGPSFKQTLEKDRALIMSQETIGLNHFAEKLEYEDLKPKYYIIGAPEIWDESLNEYYCTKGIRLFNALNTKTLWPLTIFLAQSAKKSKRINLISNKNISIVYYNNTPIEGLKFINNFLFSLKLGMPRPHNVMIPSIMIGIWMGYKKIILTGADHSWHEMLRIKDDNKVELNQKHYFDKKENWDTMKYAGKRDRKIHEIFEKWMLAFKGYFEIQLYAKKKKTTIYNASYKSYIDAFERKSINDIK